MIIDRILEKTFLKPQKDCWEIKLEGDCLILFLVKMNVKQLNAVLIVA